jgi:RNA polymerase sigma-70 factor (ECF subfamily)
VTDDDGSGSYAVALVDRIGRGDPTAEEQFVKRFRPRILSLVIARTRQSSDAEDLTQDVLLAVLRALRQGNLNEGAKLSAYVIGTARNVVNNFLRKHKPQRLDTEEIQAPRTSLPDWQMANLERRRLVGNAFRFLSQADQQILLLTLNHGLKPAEIAVRLGLSQEVVRKRKSRAIGRIKEQVHTSSRNAPSRHNDRED